MAKVSVIMPVYNGENYIANSIRTVYEYMSTLRLPFEIIVVDDGSVDATQEKAVAEARQLPGVRVISYKPNRGKGYALVQGVLHSAGDIVVFLDADLDIPPQQVKILLRALDQGEVAITNKWHPLSKTVATAFRRFASWTFNLLARILTGIRIRDTQTGAKAFKRYVLKEVIPLLSVHRYAFDLELLTAVTAKGFRVVEVPALYPIKLTGRFRVRDIVRMLHDIGYVAVKHRLLKYYSRTSQ